MRAHPDPAALLGSVTRPIPPVPGHYCGPCDEWGLGSTCDYCGVPFGAVEPESEDTLDPYGDVPTDSRGYFAAPFTDFRGMVL